MKCSLFDPLFGLISSTLREHPNIIFDGTEDYSCGEIFYISFVAKMPAPGNKADIDLDEVFAQYPDGFAVQSISDLEYTKVVRPEVAPNLPNREEMRGTFTLRVTKANWLKGEIGVVSDVTLTTGSAVTLDDAFAKCRELPEDKQQIMIDQVMLTLKAFGI